MLGRGGFLRLRLGIGSRRCLPLLPRAATTTCRSASSSSSSKDAAGAAAADDEYVANPRTIFVRKLPRSYDALMVADLCKPFGPVADVRLSYYKNSRDSKGFATVKFVDVAAADRAIEALDGTFVEGSGGDDPLDVQTGRERRGE